MTEPVITLVEEPDVTLRDAILGPLAEFNASQVGSTSVEPFAVVLKNPDDEAVIGGLWAYSARGWLFIDLLFVPDAHRGVGVGSALIRAAERAAADRGCVGVRLETFSFQAPGFYERLGYIPFGRLENCPSGHTLLCLYKALPGDGE